MSRPFTEYAIREHAHSRRMKILQISELKMLKLRARQFDRHEGSRWTSPHIVGIWLLGGLILTSLGAPSFGQPPRRDNQQSDKKRDNDDKDITDPLESLKQKLKTSRQRVEEQRQKIEAAKAAERKLGDDLSSLKARREKLKAEVPELKRWLDASFVLGDTRANNIAAIKIDGDGFTLIGNASGADVSSRIAVAIKERIPRVATTSGRELARRIATSIQPGERLSPELTSEIRNKVWTPHRVFSGVFKQNDAQPEPQFVVFRGVHSARQQIGIVQDVTPTSLTFFPVGPSQKTIERGLVEPGSVRSDLGKDILDAVDGDDTYLDYCILSIADKLSAIGREPGHMAVGLHVLLDGLQSNLDIVERRTNEYTEIDLSNVPFFFGMKLGGKIRRDNSRDIPDPHADLKRKAREVEDSIYQRMFDCGIPIVENEHVQLLRDAAKSPGDIGSRLHATHMVVAEVDRSTKGLIRLSTRLLDVKTGGQLWASNSESTCPKTQKSDNAFFLKSGTLAMISLDTNAPSAKNEELKGYESPLKVPFAHNIVTSSKPPAQQLVVLDDAAANGAAPDFWTYRPLFDRQVWKVKKSAVKTEAFPLGFPQYLSKASSKNDTSMTEQLTRAVVWELAAKGLTPAGRVEEVLENRQAFRLSIGKENDIKPDSYVRVYRPKGDSQGSDGPTDFPLPMSLRIRTLNDSSSIAVPIRTGLQGYWEEDGLWPRPGDIVYNPYEFPRKVAIFPLEGRAKSLSAKDITALSDNNAKKWQDIVQNQDELARKIQGKLRDGFLKLNSVAYESQGVTLTDRRGGVTVNVDATCAEAASKGATHVIGGFIKPVKVGDNVRYETQINLYELAKTDTGKWHLGRELVSLPVGKLGAQGWD